MDTYIKQIANLYEYNRRREPLDQQEKLPWHVINPDGWFKAAWDVATLFLVIYFAFMVPFRLGYEVPASEGFFVFETFADVMFLIDIVVSFRTAFKEDGVFVHSSRRVSP